MKITLQKLRDARTYSAPLDATHAILDEQGSEVGFVKKLRGVYTLMRGNRYSAPRHHHYVGSAVTLLDLKTEIEKAFEKEQTR